MSDTADYVARLLADGEPGRPPHTKIPGHALINGGRGVAADGSPLSNPYDSGVGKCECGETSPTFTNSASRLNWHRNHKDNVIYGPPGMGTKPPWRTVLAAETGRRSSARPSIVSPWWGLTLDCGHYVERRRIREPQRRPGLAGQRDRGWQPPPRRVRCERCPTASPTETPR